MNNEYLITITKMENEFIYPELKDQLEKDPNHIFHSFIELYKEGFTQRDRENISEFLFRMDLSKYKTIDDHDGWKDRWEYPTPEEEKLAENPDIKGN